MKIRKTSFATIMTSKTIARLSDFLSGTSEGEVCEVQETCEENLLPSNEEYVDFGVPMPPKFWGQSVSIVPIEAPVIRTRSILRTLMCSKATAKTTRF